MQFFKSILYTTTLSSIFFFISCAPESKYNGGSGALRSYESMDAYGNSTIKYRTNYTQPTQSSFSSTLVANDRDNIQQTPQNTRGQSYGGTTNSGAKPSQTSYESPVKGDGSFTPTKSLLGGMRDSEAIQRATMRPYTVRGKTYKPHPVKVGDTFDGIASWYGPDFHAKATSNGETYNMYAHTAAHKTFPMNTIVKVYNKDNGKTTVVRINDRGPFVEGRVIDLSNVAAHDIEMVKKGVANVRLEVVGFGGNLNNNTPPKDSKETQKSQNYVEAQPKKEQKPQKTEVTTSHEQAPEPRVIMKPKPAQNTYVESTPLPPLEDSARNKSQELPPQETKNPQPQQKPTQAESQAQQPKTTLPQKDINENAKDSQSDLEDFEALADRIIQEEELPKQPQATKPQPKAQIEKAQEPQIAQPEPKRIDNTQSLKDIDMAMQKLKDSTDNLAKKAQEEITPKKENEEKQATNTTPKEEPTKQDSVKQEAKQGNFMVSLNVFSQEERAKNFQQESLAITAGTSYSVGIVPTDKGLYRVALRGFQTYEEAKAFIATHSITGHVVAEDK